MSLKLPAPECSIYYPERDNNPGIIINPKRKSLKAFTLIELSIVLVIIGLIVGSVLVGRDLIKAAEVRSQITQIEKYQTAVNAFRGKYGYLPGDIPDPTASQFGFQPTGYGAPYIGISAGEGDGNGLIESFDYDGSCLNPGGGGAFGLNAFAGENGTFWVDLSKAQLIDGSFTKATRGANLYDIGISGTNSYLPQAKIGNGNYVYVWSGGWQEASTFAAYGDSQGNGINYFGISAVLGYQECGTVSNTSLTVAQAYAIDKKMDDGLPQAGNVMAMYPGTNAAWAIGGYNTASGEWASGDASSITGGPVTSAADATPTANSNSCYDGSKGLPEQYSVTYQNGVNPNCALSFKFQ